MAPVRPARACRGDPWRECYSALTGGGPGETMDSLRRVRRRLLRLCPRCPLLSRCYARAWLRDIPTDSAISSHF